MGWRPGGLRRMGPYGIASLSTPCILSDFRINDLCLPLGEVKEYTWIVVLSVEAMGLSPV